MWDEEYDGTCFDAIHTNFNFDSYVNFDLAYLTNAATSGPNKFFHNYLHICLQEYAESPFIRVCSRSNCIYPLLLLNGNNDTFHSITVTKHSLNWWQIIDVKGYKFWSFYATIILCSWDNYCFYYLWLMTYYLKMLDIMTYCSLSVKINPQSMLKV